MKTYQRTVNYLEIEGIKLELDFEPVHDSIISERCGDKMVVGYLAYDYSPDTPESMMGDGIGHLYSRHKWAPIEDRQGVEDALENPDAVWLDCFEHGGVLWSICGEGTQCLFDTSPHAGVWVPDQELKHYLNEISDTDKRRERAVEYCRQFLSEYNDVINGRVFGVVVQVFEQSVDDESDWEPVDTDACWGFIGSDHAESALKTEYFEPLVARIGEAI